MHIIRLILAFLLLNYQIIPVLSSSEAAEETKIDESASEDEHLSLQDVYNEPDVEDHIHIEFNDVLLDLESDDHYHGHDQQTEGIHKKRLDRQKDFKCLLKQKSYSTHTLITNRAFSEEWPNILAGLESLLPDRKHSSWNFFRPKVDPQIILINGIERNSAKAVRQAILSGAKFLSNDHDPLIRTTKYCPIEQAVVSNKLAALKVMLDYMQLIENNLKTIFLGGLLVRAVQAGHLSVIDCLIRRYHARYLPDSWLIQQAIMHKTSRFVLDNLVKTFRNEPELTEPHGKHQDFLLHLAVRYSNVEAFAYIFNLKSFPKNLHNGDCNLPIHLFFTLSRHRFLHELFAKYPRIVPQWTDDKGNNLLHFAVEQNRIDFVKELVEVFAFRIDSVNDDHQTPLLMAYLYERRDIALYLIGKGASLLHTDKQGTSPLLLVAKTNDLGAFQLELTLLNDRLVNMTDLSVLAQSLLINGLWECVDMLFAAFPSLIKNSFQIKSKQLMHLRSSSLLLRLPSLLEYLIKCRYVDTRSLIHQTAAEGNIRIMQLLLQSGGNNFLNAVDGNNQKPIEVAFRLGQTQMIKFLLRNGGCFIDKATTLDFFVYILNNGGSFVHGSPKQIRFSYKRDVVVQFFRYFKRVLNTQIVDFKELSSMCLQYQVFLYHYLESNNQIFNTVATIQSIEVEMHSISRLIYSQNIYTEYPLIHLLLTAHVKKTALFLQRYMPPRLQHEIDPAELIDYVYPQNIHLLQDYTNIL